MSNTEHRRLSIIDSHTGGEPTRVIVDWPADVVGLDKGNLIERRELLAEKYDWIRSASIHEPRGHDAMVGALLCPPVNGDCVTGVIFFNNVGYLSSCIHATMGLVVTLAHLGRISVGKHSIETTAGEVVAELRPDGGVTVANVPSYRYQSDVVVEVDGYGPVTGDIAWGGNWFFLVQSTGRSWDAVTHDNIPALTQYAVAISKALADQKITGEHGGKIDHVEIFGPAATRVADSRNFVLCPGQAYDRSPCGTGTSAKLACLYADGKLKEGEIWNQASISNTIFKTSFKPLDAQRITPYISGSACVNGETQLILQDADPFCYGIQPNHLSAHSGNLT